MHTMHLRDQNDGQCLQKNVQFIHHDFAVILPVNLLIHMEFIFLVQEYSKKTCNNCSIIDQSVPFQPKE